MPAPHARRSLTIIIVLFLLVADGGVAQKRKPAFEKPPRLVLIIVLDQFRYDYLQRFSDLFGAGGIKRLMREGAFWTNANYDYFPTKTAPGHTAIVTGAPPAATGIVANDWIERPSGKKVASVGDDSAKLLGGGAEEGACTPRRLLASTVGDELRFATNDRAKVIGISDKPRAAILPAGRRANAAYWLSSDVGNVISSNYYFPRLPDWVTKFNRTSPLDKYFGARWERLLPEAVYLKYAGPDSPAWENIGEAPGFTNAFPHTITGGAKGPGHEFYEALDHSPFVNEIIVDVAEQAITHEQLGEDEITDLLTVSLSGSDHVGHRFGPYSQEVMDVALRADLLIGRLLDFVNARVGLRNTLVVLTSDHGVAPLWDQSVALGRGGRIDNAEVIAAIRSAVRARYARISTGSNAAADRGSSAFDPTADYIIKYLDEGLMKDAMIDGNVYFNLTALKRDGVKLDEITRLAGEAALKVPGIARYFTRADLEKCRKEIPACPGCRNSLHHSAGAARRSFIPTLDTRRPTPCASDPIARRVLRGFNTERSGDLIIVQKPFHHLGDSADPANHGSPYSYDTHVPLIIMGSGFKAARYRKPATPADIAPTISLALQIRPPNKSQARILREALTFK